MEKGMVFDIQRFAVHDGRGIRTNVFLKGCPLTCRWCCNPESQKAMAEIGYHAMACIGCGQCSVRCSRGAVNILESGRREFDFSKCMLCREKSCVDGCSATAISLFGRIMTADEVVEEVDKDREFYWSSGGGVTVSGGEPLMQAGFAARVLRMCRDRGYNTAIETCSHVPFAQYEEVIPYVDEFLCDIKHVDAEIFRQWTDGDLELILENLRLLAAKGCNITARVPVIPGFNDDAETIRGISRFSQEIGLKEINLLPYHRLGKSKYEKLGRPYLMGDTEVPEEQKMRELAEIPKQMGLHVNIGG